MDILTYRNVVELFKHYPVDKSGFPSDDNGWSDHAILENILIARTHHIKQALKNNEDLGLQYIQTIPCVNLEIADRNECPCAPLSGCYWVKVSEPLPKLIKLISINTVLGMDNFNYVRWDQIKHKLHSRTSEDAKFYTFRESKGKSQVYLYLPIQEIKLEIASITGIFEDPYCVHAYPCCGDVDTEAKCNPWDTPIYVDREILHMLLKDVWNTLLPVRAAAGWDWTGDSQDNTKGTQNPQI